MANPSINTRSDMGCIAPWRAGNCGKSCAESIETLVYHDLNVDSFPSSEADFQGDTHPNVRAC